MKAFTRISCIGLAAAGLLLVYAAGQPRAEDTAAPAKAEQTQTAAPMEKAVATAAPAVTGEDVYVVPHKALYAFNLVKIDSGNQLSNINGQMFFELQDGCDAWTTDHRFDLQYDYAERPSADITSEFNTWEGKDGKTFHFGYMRKANDKVIKELRGTVEQDDSGKTDVTYHTPEDLELDLPDNTFFPVAHTIEVARQAMAGKKFFTSHVFDGSDDEGASLATAFIGKPVNAVAELNPDPAFDMDLLNSKAWRVRLAFFKADSQDAEPQYEMSAILHQNGVISDVVIDYPAFTIHQELTAIEALPLAEGCN